jgi:hypothetical protein
VQIDRRLPRLVLQLEQQPQRGSVLGRLHL